MKSYDVLAAQPSLEPTAPVGARCIAAFYIRWRACSEWRFCKLGAAAQMF